MELPKVIGLVGFKQSGKDTVCELIQKVYPWYTRVAFADPVRSEAQAILDGTTPFPCDLPPSLAQLYEDQFDENVMLRHSGYKPITVYDRPYTPRIRAILQQHGTEYRRAQDPEYWTKAWERAILPLRGGVIVTDVRFPNEEQVIRKHGGAVWLVWRGMPAVEDIHESESHVLRLPVDGRIDNVCTLDELESRVAAALQAMKGRRQRESIGCS